MCHARRTQAQTTDHTDGRQPAMCWPPEMVVTGCKSSLLQVAQMRGARRKSSYGLTWRLSVLTSTRSERITCGLQHNMHDPHSCLTQGTQLCHRQAICAAHRPQNFGSVGDPFSSWTSLTLSNQVAGADTLQPGGRCSS